MYKIVAFGFRLFLSFFNVLSVYDEIWFYKLQKKIYWNKNLITINVQELQITWVIRHRNCFFLLFVFCLDLFFNYRVNSIKFTCTFLINFVFLLEKTEKIELLIDSFRLRYALNLKSFKKWVYFLFKNAQMSFCKQSV